MAVPLIEHPVNVTEDREAPQQEGDNVWIIYSMGYTIRVAQRIGCVIIPPFKEIVEKAIRLGFSTSNN